MIVEEDGNMTTITTQMPGRVDKNRGYDQQRKCGDDYKKIKMNLQRHKSDETMAAVINILLFNVIS